MAVTVSKLNNTFATNVVSSKTLKKYQSKILDDLTNILTCSFGPYGSNTCMKQVNGPNVYTKDGHTILKNVKFSGIIEESIRSDIESITQHIVTTVGDGTTSAVLLSKYLFDGILDIMEKKPQTRPADIVRTLNRVCAKAAKEIRKSSHPASMGDIENIALIAANGDTDIANMITDIYEESGMGVFIDVAPTTAKETTILVFDGMSIDTGFSDSCYVTNTQDNSAVVDHPHIYFFEDPIDTKELGVLLDAILNKNIIEPAKKQKFGEMIPTVIIAPKVSRDMSSLLDAILDTQRANKPGNKLPFILISDVHQMASVSDICSLCGGKLIHKYIDAKIYKEDVKSGLAPTKETVVNWSGTCDQVVAYSNRTKFINPCKKTNSDGTPSDEFNNLLGFLQTELDKCIKDGEDSNTIGKLRRRINSLKSNLVEIHAGGMTPADRDANRDLIEDAVKNCRSAAANGVGWASNFSGYLILKDLETSKFPEVKDKEERELEEAIIQALRDAYYKLISVLFENSFGEKGDKYLSQSIDKRCPINIRTKKFDYSAVSSIESDIIVMQSVAKIIGIMVTCNQFLTPTPQMNVYEDIEEVK